MGETQDLIVDFLCSMWQNINGTFPGGGLTCSTNVGYVLSEMTRVKKGIEECFWGDPDARWPKYEENQEDVAKFYTFDIAKAGYPDKGISIDFTCVTPSVCEDKYLNETSSLWVLVDGATKEEV